MKYEPDPPPLEGRSDSLRRHFHRGIQCLTQSRLGRTLVIALPYAWLVLFLLVPLLLVLKISFAEVARATPPFSALWEMLQDNSMTVRLYFGNYRLLWEDALYGAAYLHSLRVALVSTFFCLLLGYPMAYAIVRAPPRWRIVLLMLVILPFWTSFLLRVYAWIGLLQGQGLINQVLLWMGVIGQPLRLLHSNFAVYLGIVYSYLPFMILPLYATLVRLEDSLLEAAADLGCPPWKAFWTVTVPLSFPGILAGSLLVLIPAVGEFVIPDLLGGPDSLMIGKVLWVEFFANRDWPMAAAIAMAMLLLLVLPLLLLQSVLAPRSDGKDS
jgi:putrescine transport system permease protein